MAAPTLVMAAPMLVMAAPMLAMASPMVAAVSRAAEEHDDVACAACGGVSWTPGDEMLPCDGEGGGMGWHSQCLRPPLGLMRSISGSINRHMPACGETYWHSIATLPATKVSTSINDQAAAQGEDIMPSFESYHGTHLVCTAISVVLRYTPVMCSQLSHTKGHTWYVQPAKSY